MLVRDCRAGQSGEGVLFGATLAWSEHPHPPSLSGFSQAEKTLRAILSPARAQTCPVAGRRTAEFTFRTDLLIASAHLEIYIGRGGLSSEATSKAATEETRD